MKEIPKLFKIAMSLNLIGLFLLCLSLTTNSPLQLALAFSVGVTCLLSAFIFWIAMVLQEASRKGMLD
ncbi:MAG: hypothetical protein HQK84_04865 [Nitrospinae bacterium]|nr:hypothetical protein [Nitrospinota bacterium]